MERKVFLLLDRSGSMSSFEKPVVAGINAFIGNYILDIGRKQEHPCTRQGGTNHGEVRHG